MAVLHTVNQSPSRNGCLFDCLRLCQPADAVLLLEDGVFGAVDSTNGQQALAQTPLAAVYALADDVGARGLQQRLHSAVQLVDYNTFVALCTEYDKVVSWY